MFLRGQDSATGWPGGAVRLLKWALSGTGSGQQGKAGNKWAEGRKRGISTGRVQSEKHKNKWKT